MSLGTQIRKIRIENNLTQGELGKLLITKKSPQGVDSSVVANWENDKRRPRTYFLQKISEVLKKPISWFFGEVYYSEELENMKSDLKELKKQVGKISEYSPAGKTLSRYRWGWPGDTAKEKEYFVDSVVIDPNMFSKQADFILVFEDDYLKDLGIVVGDNLLIKKQHLASNGDLVFIRLDNELMVRTYQKSEKKISLATAHPDFTVIDVRNDQKLTLLGKVIGRFKDF
ncbi:MAG: XRE family transcriptional regulator [Elusimicrobiota bacterium]